MDSISFTVANELCTGCGLCEGACPSKAIKMMVQKGRFLPVINNVLCKNDKGCHRCYDTCPGIGVDLLRIAKEIFVDEQITNDKLIGHYLKCYTGHSNNYDIRYHCASGGMVTQFLIFLLQKKLIDGAIVTSFDPTNELLVNSFIARTPEEILKGKSSKYAPVTLNHAIQDIKASKGKYVIVGLPCHIEGFRKYEYLDKNIQNKIIGYFAIYCSGSRTFGFTEYIMKERNIDLKGLSYLSYRDNGCLGGLVAKGKDTKNGVPFNYYEDYQKYCHPLRSIFIPKRCILCVDHYGELSDISFGDIHIAPYIHDKIGVNSLIVRKKKWIDLLIEAKNESCITLNEISAQTLNESQRMAYVKKSRNAKFILLIKKAKGIAPVFDSIGHENIDLKTVFQYFHNRIQQYIGRNRHLWFLIKYIKGKSPNL